MSSFGRGSRFNEGDWTCPDCSNINFARRSHCNRCGTERKYEVKKIKKGGIEIGKQAAEKSRGLFSAEDWMCKTCGNVNWARRNDCNMCNTPKVNVQEERTGFGGGFNERAGVEYKEKEDSDGEYDEFGRKKKKYRGAIGSVSSISKKNDEEEDESDEDVSKYDLEADDDDEDDDDAATSKYDLEASDEEDSEKKSDLSDKSSRSRSRSRTKNGESRSRSRSNSRSRRRRSTSSSGSDDSRGHKRHKHRHRHHKKRSRSRSRSPHYRRRRSSSFDRHSNHR